LQETAKVGGPNPPRPTISQSLIRARSKFLALNLSWAAIAFFVILIGGLSGFYVISVLGVFILIASLIAPSRTSAPRRQPLPQGRVGTPTRSPPQRQAPPSQAQAESKLLQMPQPTSQTMFPQDANQGYASNMALFPASMFPSTSPVATPAQPQVQKKPSEVPEPRDELVEMGAILLFLRLISG